ncbi:MAG: caspase family protein [Crocinitomicaceae bacterium]
MRFKLSILFLFVCSIALAEVQPEVVFTSGHSQQVNAMVTSPNGRFLASSGNDKVIKIWEIATTQEYRTLSGFDGQMNEIIFSKDNIHLAGLSTQGELVVWNVLSGEEQYRSESGKTFLKGLAFSKDGSKIIHCGNDGIMLTVTNWKEGTSESSEIASTALVLDSNKQIVYVLDHKGNLNYFDFETEQSIKTIKLFDEFNYPFTRLDVSTDGRYLACGFNDDVLRIFDTSKDKFIYEYSTSPIKLKDLAFDPKNPLLYVSLIDTRVLVFNYEKMKLVDEFKSGIFTAQSIAAHPKGEVIILANHSEISFYDVKRKKSFKQLAGKTAPISWICHDPNNEFLAVANDEINVQLWDLKLNKVVRKIQGYKPCQFSADGKHVFLQTTDSKVGKYNIEKGVIEQSYNTNSIIQMSMAVSPDGKYMAAGGITGVVTVWDVEKNVEIAVLTGHTGIVTSVDFHPTLPILVSTSYDQTSRIWDFKKKIELKQFQDQIICVSDAKFSPDGKLLATAAWDRTILVRDVETWSIIYKLEGHKNSVQSIDFNAESTLLCSAAGNNAVLESDNSVITWDLTTGEELCRMAEHKTTIPKITFDDNNGRIYSASKDGAIIVTEPTKCEVVATYLGTKSEDFVVYTPDNYYMASKSALKSLAFRISNRLVAFEQFDIYLNRPDIIAERLNKSPEQVKKAYHYLYKKRLRKLNLEEGSLKIDYAIPKIINETEVDLVTAESNLKLIITAWDETHNIKQINVFVNDVPIYGEAGYQLKKPVKSIQKELNIPLVEGENKIQFSAVNSNGAESLYETVEIIRQGQNVKHDLYIVAIGVSNYQDDRFNLTYPTKDARDVVSKMSESKENYNEVYTKLLLDADATRENIEGLTSFFKNCSYEDLAIIFIAGHGVLNVDFDYYFGTQDMDFDHPEDKGLAYESIHQLLNKIKAYRKLLIMDTCHSGELDKEEIEAAPNPEVIEGDIKFRNAGVGVREKQGYGFENSVGLLQDIFSDTRKGSGATVISSAGGAEYAMESDQWQNGLFTHALLEGLKTPASVGNGDSQITVSEIRAFVHQKVEELSDGKQIPTAREENISQDYIIFGQ